MLKSAHTLIASSMASSDRPAARKGATSAGRTSFGWRVSFSRNPSVARSFASSGAVRQLSTTACTNRSSCRASAATAAWDSVQKTALIELRGERCKQLAFPDAPLGRPAHHRLRPFALRPAEELGPVHQRLHDVGDAAPADQPDESQHELLRQPMTMLDRADAH